MSDIQAKIRIGDGGVEGFNQFTLKPGYVTNPDTPYEMQQVPITNLTGQNQLATFHDSDDGPPEIINLEENNRVWAFTLKVDAGSRPSNLVALSTLKRHISGKQSTAYQSYRNGSQEPVWFDIRLDSDSLWTSFRIMRGVVDDGQSFYTTASDTNEKALSCLVNLTCVPAGRGEVIELRNDLPNSPHFLQEGTGGMGLGWENFTGSGTYTLITGSYVVGGQAQQVQAADVGDGIYMAASTTEATGTDYAGYIWIFPSASPVEVVLTTYGGTVFASAEVSTGDTSNADKSYVDLTGKVWYRIPVSGTSVGVGCRLGARAVTGPSSTTWFMDAAYVTIGATTVPDGFCSSSSLSNRNDAISGTAAERQRINFLDVWGIPGDVPAILKTRVDMTASEPKRSVLTTGKLDSSIPAPSDSLYVYEPDDMTGFGLVKVVDVTRSAGAYIRYPGTGSAFPGTNFGVGNTSLFQGTWRVFGLVRTQDLTSTIQLKFSKAGSTLPEFFTPILSNTLANTWETLDFGILNFTNIMNRDESDSVSVGMQLFLYTSGATNIDIDCFYFIPVIEYITTTTEHTYGGDIIISGEEKQVYATAQLNQPYAGGLWDTSPFEMTRFMYMLNYQDLTHELDSTMNISLEIIPMASHLLGASDTLLATQLPA